MGTTVGEDYSVQQARVRECLKHGRAIGPTGAFYCTMAEAVLQQADRAAMSGDIVAQVSAYQAMVEFED